MYRDLTMKEISEQQIGQTLQVAGWVENIRDHGGVSFIDLRDMYGVLQVVIRKPELLKGITKEMCLSITGLMEHRDEETYNPKILPAPSNWKHTRSMCWEEYINSFLSRSRRLKRSGKM